MPAQAMSLTGAPGTLSRELAGLAAVLALCLVYVLLVYCLEARRRRRPTRS